MKVTTIKANNERCEAFTLLTPKQYLTVNFAGWGFYKVIKVSALKYQVFDKFENAIVYTITFSYR